MTKGCWFCNKVFRLWFSLHVSLYYIWSRWHIALFERFLVVSWHVTTKNLPQYGSKISELFTRYVHWGTLSSISGVRQSLSGRVWTSPFSFLFLFLFHSFFFSFLKLVPLVLRTLKEGNPLSRGLKGQCLLYDICVKEFQREKHVQRLPKGEGSSNEWSKSKDYSKVIEVSTRKMSPKTTRRWKCFNKRNELEDYLKVREVSMREMCPKTSWRRGEF